MMCSGCGADNRQGRRYCAKCGAPLALGCAACGFANEPGDEFCGGCGQRLAAVVAPAEPAPGVGALPPEAERRQLTVMFCDLVGSTALAGRLDPEELREHIRAYQAASAEAIARHEGHVAQYLGDGLLVYFGYPVAHEDDPQRAVRAALAITDAVGRLNRQGSRAVTLAVRIGIHTGLVVVGEMGGGSRREQLALGATPNVAARLEELAEPNTVVISAATHRLVERVVACRDLGVHALRGVDASQMLYQVLGERPAVTRTEGMRAGPSTPLIGREREIALVLERWEATAERQGAVVLLSGEPGIGKTRIVQAVCERVQGVPHTLIEGRCSPYWQHSPMQVVAELLRGVVQDGEARTPEGLLGRLEQVLTECDLGRADGVPLLAALLDLPTDEASPVLSWAPQRQKQRTIEIVLDLLRAQATARPLLLLVEDLHWIDASSLELLTLLVDQVATASICVLLTARPTFHPPWAARSHTTHVTLARLPRRQTEQMVLGVAANRPLPADVLQHVVTGSDGVPLFAEELTKTILESGLLRDRDGRYELTAPLGSLAIPATLHDSLMARLDRLPEAKPVAQLAATIGREFSYALLRAVSPLSEAALTQELARLVDAELLYQRGLPPSAQYTFKHALIQEAAYQSLLRSTRQQSHRRIVGVLAEQFPEIGESHPELMAHHYSEAGLVAEAIPYWQRAGESAVRRSAHSEATAHLQRGLALVSALPPSPERARLELGLLMALGPVLFGSRGFAAAETERVYARAQELCAELGDTPEVFPALWGQWGFFQLQGDMPRALQIAEQLLIRARRSGDPALLLEANHALWPTRLNCGAVEAALQSLQEGLAVYDPARHRSLAYAYGGHDAGVCGFAFQALTLWVLGYPQRALESAQRSLQLARELAHPHSAANAGSWVALMLRYRGDLQAARAQAEATQAISAEHGFPQWGALATIIRGSTLAALGQVEDGLAEMQRGLAGWRATGAGAFLTIFLTFIVEAELAAGDAEAGLAKVREALGRAQTHAERIFESELHRLNGELLLRGAAADPAGAEACFRRALEVARGQRAKGWELRAAVSLAQLWQRQGRLRDAHDVLADVTAWFTEGFDTLDLATARALLDELPGPR
jgi:class 3 adenylate cyclase/predicted ATPase